MTTTAHTTGHASSNALARERDARIVWLLSRHPVTAAMLVEIRYFASRKRALRRLQRLVARKQLKIAGTVLLSAGRAEQVYCRGQWVKPDNVLHEVQVSRVCFKIHADEVRRGTGEVDAFLRPDAELLINGRRFLLEVDLGSMGVNQVVNERFSKYRACRDFVLWVCCDERRMEALRQRAEGLSAIALFTSLPLALRNPHAAIWLDHQGDRAALPHTSRLGKKGEEQAGEKGEENGEE